MSELFRSYEIIFFLSMMKTKLRKIQINMKLKINHIFEKPKKRRAFFKTLKQWTVCTTAYPVPSKSTKN